MTAANNRLATLRRARATLAGGASLWLGTIAFGGSTVALLAVLSRYSHRSSFSALAALLSLSFVAALIPAGVQLRSATLVADGQPPPKMGVNQAIVTAGASLAISPLFAFLLHVPVAAAALVSVQLVIAIPLAAKQGALMALHRFGGLGLNLVIEGSARFLCGAAAGRAFGVTGLAAGITVGTAVALLVLRLPMASVPRHKRPRTSLIGTSLTLALLGLYVQVDVLIAPSVLSRAGATTYDLSAVPSKGVYLALLAAGPLLFPFVRRRQGGRRLIAGSALVTLSIGVVVTALLVAARPLIAAVLGRPKAGLVDLSLLGLAMAFAGVTAIVTTAAVARGVKRPWPPSAIGIASLLLCLAFGPDVFAFSVAVLASEAFTAVLSVVNCFWGRVGDAESDDPRQQIESLAEAGDPLASVQGSHELSGSEPGEGVYPLPWIAGKAGRGARWAWARRAKGDT